LKIVPHGDSTTLEGRREVVEGLATCGRGAGRGGSLFSKEGVPLDPYLSSNFSMEYETHPNTFPRKQPL
jgi:hypothetical protein